MADEKPDDVTNESQTPEQPEAAPAEAADTPAEVGEVIESNPSVSVAGFDQLEDTSQGQTHSIDMLMEVILDVSIELGRTTMSIKDILALGVGSVIEVDKMVGDPVDILVNNKLIARGEVVVVDENFGVRISSVASAEERLGTLK